MTPQRLNRARSTGYGAKAHQFVTDETMALGMRYVVICSYVDVLMSGVLSAMLRTDHNALGIALACVWSPNVKREIASKIAQHNLQDADFATFQQIHAHTKHLETLRNALCHYPLGWQRDADSKIPPDQFVLFDPAQILGSATRAISQARRQGDDHSSERAHALRERNRKKTMLYTRDHLRSAIRRAEWCADLLKCFEGVLLRNSRSMESQTRLAKLLASPP